jgi:hypothetical protein
MPTLSDQDLQDRVLHRLDEKTPEGQAPAVPAEILRDELVEAALDVIQVAPQPLVHQAAQDVSGQVTAELVRRGGYVAAPLPEFSRILRVQLVSWTMHVDEQHLVTSESDAYNRLLRSGRGLDSQKSYELLDASQDRPAAVVSPALGESDLDAPSGTELHLFPEPALVDDQGEPYTPALDHLLIIPALDPSQTPRELIDPLCWRAAARVAKSWLQAPGTAQACEEEYESSMSRRAIRADRLNTQPSTKRRTRRRGTSF